MVVLAGAAAGAYLLHQGGHGGGGDPPATETVKVGDVRSTVAGVGTLEPKTSVSLGFGSAGRVKSVDVRLGQQVKAGQVLARLDDGVPKASLQAAHSQVAAAEAKVGQLREGHTPEERTKAGAEAGGARRALAGARRTAGKARRVAAAEVATLNATLAQDRKSQQVALKRLAGSRSKLGRKNRRMATEKERFETDRSGLEVARSQVVALAGTREANRKKAEEEEAKERKKIEETEAKEREKAEAEEKEFRGREQSVVPRNTETGTGYAEAQAQSRLEIAQGYLTESQGAFERARSETETLRTSLPSLRDTARSSAEAVATARTALHSGAAAAAQNVRTADQAVETAQTALTTALAAGAAELQPTKAGEMAEALAAVSQAEGTVATDQKSLEETVLRAPTAGRVANLKLAVGDVVSGGSTSQSKAGTSSEGGEGGATGGGEGEGSTSAAGSSGGPSIVLTSPRLRLFTVSLTQADAVKVKSGDRATLTVDALSRAVKGTLVSVTPLPQIKNGVVNYSATVATEELPRDVRVGMTAEVTILTANHKDVPLLSPAALPASTGTVSVQVLDHGRREPRTVHLGITGDQGVEIAKGLRPGERVLLPKLPAAGSFEEEGSGEEEGGEEGFEG